MNKMIFCRRIQTIVGCPVGLLFLMMLTGCSSLTLQSRWCDSEAVIDGKGSGWNDTLIVLDDKHTSVGLLNNENYLFIKVVTTSRDLERQVVRQGLTFWFDTDGGEQKKFGVRFPLGFDRPAGLQRERKGNSESPRSDSLMIPVNNLEILGPSEGEQHRMTFAEATGIDARFQTSRDTLTYTLKIPISSSGNFPFTIGARLGTVIGVSIETSNVGSVGRSAEDSGQEGGRRGGGGFGGRGGYGGRRGTGGGRSGQGEQTKPFNQFVKLRLATPASTSH